MSSSRIRVFCPICMDYKPAGQMFRISICRHSFCMECMGTYISTRIRDNISHLICPDPNCRVKLHPSNCRQMVPKEVFEKWKNAFCKAAFLVSGKRYMSVGNFSNKLDDMATELARKLKWQRCPNCMFYVEKNEGCNHITCRCCYQFCYTCGGAWNGNGHLCAN